MTAPVPAAIAQLFSAGALHSLGAQRTVLALREKGSRLHNKRPAAFLCALAVNRFYSAAG